MITRQQDWKMTVAVAIPDANTAQS